jgi:hypothetical protein
MRFLVLGAGALGGYFGGMLLRGGADVSFLVRPRRSAQLAEQGLIVHTPSGDIKRPVRTLLAGEVDSTYDFVLLTCKAYDLDSALEAIGPAIGKDSAVLPFLSGTLQFAGPRGAGAEIVTIWFSDQIVRPVVAVGGSSPISQATRATVIHAAPAPSASIEIVERALPPFDFARFSWRRLRREEITGEIIELSAGRILAAASLNRKKKQASAAVRG